jgi:hypothetical protein
MSIYDSWYVGASAAADAAQQAQQSNQNAGTKWWQNIGDWINAGSNLYGTIKGNPDGPDTVIYQQYENPDVINDPNRAGVMTKVIIGVLIAVTVISVAVIWKRKS